MEVMLPIKRLDDRLQYLTGRYKNTAPYWQFVLWARQLAIIGIVAGFEAYDDTAMVLAEAGVTFAVLGATLVLHILVKPYEYPLQNVGEIVLTSLSMLAIVVGCVAYWHRIDNREVSADVFGVALVGMLLGPAVLFAIYAGIKHHRIKPKPLLIYHCSPSKDIPLPHVRREAEEVKTAYMRPNSIQDAEASCGTSERLRQKLILKRPALFLFAGHADTELDPGKRTLAFVDENGGIDVVRPETLVDVFRSLRERRGDVLELVFLNGCQSEELGRALCEQANVPWVVCWRTKCDDEAARLFSVHFFEALGRAGALEEEPYRFAFYEAKSAVESGQKLAGTLANGRTPAQVPKFVFRPIERRPPQPLASPTGRGNMGELPESLDDDDESGEPAAQPTQTARPSGHASTLAIEAGVPVLLFARPHNECGCYSVDCY